MEGDYIASDYQAVDSDNYETYWNEAEVIEDKGEDDE
jgi:hypothetical protein